MQRLPSISVSYISLEVICFFYLKSIGKTEKKKIKRKKKNIQQPVFADGHPLNY
jgi:hypothetical protein